MKKIMSIMLGLALFLNPTLVLAQETEVDPGVTPDDGFMYGIDVALDEIRYAISQNKEAVGLEIARERLAEKEMMEREGKEDEARDAENNMEQIKEKVRNHIREQVQKEALQQIPEDVSQTVEQRVQDRISQFEEKVPTGPSIGR